MSPDDFTGGQIDGLEAAEFAVRIRPRPRGETNVVAARRDLSTATWHPAVIRTGFDQRYIQDISRRIESRGRPVARAIGIGAQKRGLAGHGLKSRAGVLVACDRV